jgi:hypothetical protein
MSEPTRGCGLGRSLDDCNLRRRAGCTRLYDVLVHLAPPAAVLAWARKQPDREVQAWLHRVGDLTEVTPRSDDNSQLALFAEPSMRGN